MKPFSEGDPNPSIVILIIDSDSEYRALLRDFLELKGFKVLEAGDANQATQTLMEKPDLVIVDPIFSNAGGRLLMKMIKSGKFPNRSPLPIPIILHSTLTHVPEEMRPFIDAHLEKPTELSNLEALITQILNSRGHS